jgi:ABC-2 type transport system ATP-binding protein
MLLGLIRPTRGSSSLFGETVVPGSAVLSRVGALVERPAIYPYLSASDNLRLFGLARGIAQSRLESAVPEALDRVGLSEAAKRSAGRFSTGMRQRLATAVALLGSPELVVLDEPANGLDPNGVVEVRQLISNLAREGTTIFLSSHVLPEVEQLCDRVAILQRGRIVAEGETKAMLQEGERLHVRFDDRTMVERARSIVAQIGETTAGEAEADFFVLAGASRGSDVIRALASNDFFPAEVAVRRQTLESVFIDITREHEPGVPVEPAAGSAASPRKGRRA